MNEMGLIFEVKKSDLETIEEIRASGCEILSEETSNGANGSEFFSIFVALTDVAKELAGKLAERKPVSIKFCDEFGPVELVARNREELYELIDKYVEIHNKRITKEEAANGTNEK